MRRRLARGIAFVKRVITPGESLAERTAKGGLWMTATNGLDRALQIALLVVLARLLDPADFGLMGIALLTLSALRRFSRMGLQDALIQHLRDDVDDYLHTAWTVAVARGTALAAVAYLGAPFVASFFSEPRATDVLRVVALSPLLNGLRNPAVVYFRKHIEFHKQFVYVLSGSLTNFAVAVGLGLVFRNVWALVFGYVAADAVRTTASFAMHRFRPFPRFDRSHLAELFAYGKWITGTEGLQFLISEGDDAVVGFVLTAASLGFYQVAYRIAKAPATEVATIVSSVTFPAYSKLQDDVDSLRSVFFRTVQVTTLFSFPVSVGIIATSPTFVRGFLGQEWQPIVPVMQLVGLYGLLVSLGATFGPVWKAMGRPDYITKLSLLRVVLMALVIFPAVEAFGIVGAAGVVVGVYLFPVMPLDIYLVVNAVETSYRRLFKELAYPGVASAGMGAAVVWIDRLQLVEAAIPEFLLLVVAGMLSYLGAVAVLETRFGWGLERNLRSIVDAAGGV